MEQTVAKNSAKTLMQSFESWLASEYFNNTIEDYLIALLLLVLVWIAAKIFLERIARNITKYLVRGEHGLSRALETVRSSVHPLTIPILAVYTATTQLKLHERFERFIGVAITTIVIVQLTVTAIKLSDVVISSMRFGRAKDDLSIEATRKNLKSIAQTAIVIIAIMSLLANIGIDITTFVTGLGIGGVAVALAVQSLLGDVFGSFSIALDKPFEIGDFVVVDEFRGTIEQVGLKTTRIRSIDGQLLVFANTDLTKARIQNYKKMESRRVLFQIGVVYGTKSELLRKIPDMIRNIIESKSRLRFERCHFMAFGDFSLNYEIVYYVDSNDYLTYCDLQQSINLDITAEFEKNGIEFAFPTQTIFLQNQNSQPIS